MVALKLLPVMVTDAPGRALAGENEITRGGFYNVTEFNTTLSN